MTLTNKDILKEALDNYSITPKKSLGQNFVIDKNVIKKICDCADLSKEDQVLEIGPGTGALTLSLAEKVTHVTAIEKDRRLMPLLLDLTKETKNISVVHSDILDFSIPFKKYKVIANLPYYVTSPIIKKFLEEYFPPEMLVLTVQREVAERIIAKPPKMSLLSVSVQFYADAKIISHISKNSFWPPPSIESSIIKITPKKNSFDKAFKEDFFRILRKGFSHPRKQILTNFQLDREKKSGVDFTKREIICNLIKKSNVDARKRPESLNIDQWKSLTKNLSKII